MIYWYFISIVVIVKLHFSKKSRVETTQLLKIVLYNKSVLGVQILSFCFVVSNEVLFLTSNVALEEDAATAAAGEDEDGKRAITYQISRNKGLTPKRKKEQRNPRVKHRKKFRKAVIKRKSQVNYKCDDNLFVWNVKHWELKIIFVMPNELCLC